MAFCANQVCHALHTGQWLKYAAEWPLLTSASADPEKTVVLCFKGNRSSAKGDIGLGTTRDRYTFKTRYWTARWPRAAVSLFRMRALDLTRLKLTLLLTPSIGLMESMGKGQMTTLKEKLKALHDVLSDAYDEDQANDDPTC